MRLYNKYNLVRNYLVDRALGETTVPFEEFLETQNLVIVDEQINGRTAFQIEHADFYSRVASVQREGHTEQRVLEMVKELERLAARLVPFLGLKK